jgi:Carboxypeptidase regulatory-like domain
LNKKITAVTILFLIAFAAVIAPLAVNAQNTNLGVTIITVTPTDATGTVGTAAAIQGTIYTSNGSYQIIIGPTVVTSGISQGYYVYANFSVPELPSGTYSLILRDVDINVNSTQQFTINTGYSVNAVPSSIQEGSSLVFNVSVTGGTIGTSYYANISVALPSPAGTLYTKTVALGTANDKGTASAQVAFPDSSFLPSGSLTDYAGTYTVYFNQSQSLAQSTFAANFIDSTTYHRGDTVGVRATGYQPNEPATLIVTSVKSGSTLDTASVTASADGVISTTWVVPSTADIGNYTVKISPQNTPKLVPDSQNFTVPGYSIKVKTTNLAGEVVSGISLQAQDGITNTVYNAVSGPDGTANFKLEKGTQVLTDLWNGVNVGQTNITVSGDATFTIQVQLTDLKITVKNTDGIVMPFVDLNIIYRYQSSEGAKTGNATGQTDPTGSYILNSTLPGASYTIDASVHDQIFNAGNNTVNSLPIQVTTQVFIIAPSETVTISVVGYNQEAISSARIELVELSNGLFYSATADSNGAATIQATFGQYRARVYKDTTLINETTIDVFTSNQQQIRCTLYGIELFVKVVDFFGSPISNVNVTLNGPTTVSASTKGDGTATFNDIIGGDMQIIAQYSSTKDATQAVTLTVNQPTSVQIKMEKYVAFGSVLIQTSLLFSILIILVATVVLVIVEVFRRRRVKQVAAT